MNKGEWCRDVLGAGLLGVYRRESMLSYVCGMGGVRCP